eukprot:m.29195 g.29195  ORF g.29195 m.29195 type:complete len:372 (+) comp5064_c0_seq2:217-1332(+)
MWEIDIVLDFCTQTVVYVPVLFRASGIVILFFLGWGINVRGFQRFGIPFRKVLDLRPTISQPEQILVAVRLLTAILLTCYLLYELFGLYYWDLGQSIMLVLFWLILSGLCLFSPHSVFRQLREFVLDRFRALVHASEPAFVDVLAADVLTSMSKLLADLEIVLCAVLAMFSATPDTSKAACMHSLVGPILASVPYVIRSYQCILSFRATGSSLQLVNFGKYVSSFPVIWTSALKHLLAPAEGLALDGQDEHLQVLWLYAVTVNTLYSFVWDVVMDWGLAHDPHSKYPLLRSDLRYKNALYYYCAILMDLTLRLCWSLKLSSHLQRHATGQAFVFLFEVLEVFRRFVWNFFRVEWECIKRGEADTPPIGDSA